VHVLLFNSICFAYEYAASLHVELSQVLEVVRRGRLLGRLAVVSRHHYVMNDSGKASMLTPLLSLSARPLVGVYTFRSSDRPVGQTVCPTGRSDDRIV